MIQEEFGLYWGHGREVFREKIGPFDVVAVVLPPNRVRAEEGFAACMVGRGGDFAGSFKILGGGPVFSLRGRWCSPSGAWYSFHQELVGPSPVEQLIDFVRRVIERADQFKPGELGSRLVE